MKALKDKNYTEHYIQMAEAIEKSIRVASKESDSLFSFLQKLWVLGYKIQPIKPINRKYKSIEALSVLESMLHIHIPDWHKTKIIDILNDCPAMSVVALILYALS